MYRYMVVRDEGMKVWTIYDNETKQFLGLHFQDKGRARAKVKELSAVKTKNASDSEGFGVLGEEHRITDKKAAADIVLSALNGKVKCSACDAEFRDPCSTAPGIKVTRYIGFADSDLTVDLSCSSCNHGGLYQFSGNPLVDAGIVKKDIPF